MTHKTSDQTRCHWGKQMPSTLFLCMMPAYRRLTSPAESTGYRVPTESTGNMMRPWRKGAGASWPSTAENVSPLSRAANHAPACDCIFTAAKVELLCAMQWTSGHAMQSTTTTLSIIAPQNQFIFSRTDWCCHRRPLRGVHLFWWPCGVPYRMDIRGHFRKLGKNKLSETK